MPISTVGSIRCIIESIASLKVVHIVRISCQVQQHTAQCFQCHFQECAELEPETQDFEGGGWRVIPGVILGTSEQLTSSPVTSKMDLV